MAFPQQNPLKKKKTEIEAKRNDECSEGVLDFAEPPRHQRHSSRLLLKGWIL